MNSRTYLGWKRGSIKHLWLFGKAGCGKTVMSATIIHDIRMHCQGSTGSACGMFYFDLSDERKQSYESCLRSLVSQLTTKEPALSMLGRLHRLSRGRPQIRDLEQILLTAIDSYSEVFIILDALDESSENSNGGHTERQRLMDQLIQLSRMAPKLSFLMTSRDLLDIRRTMGYMGALAMHMATKSLNQDIIKYVRSQFVNDVDLARLDETAKTEIEAAVSLKSDGM